jgi:hypothetical protein
MVKDDGSVRTDAVDLELGDHRVRVVCDDADGIEVLRSALVDHVIDQPAPVGFAVRAPSTINGFHVVLDQAGLVLGRLRSSDDALAVLAGHLAGLLPPPAGTVRVRGRVFAADDATASLVCFPLFLTPPAVERRLDRDSICLIDRLAIDVTPDATFRVGPIPWPELAGASPAGHRAQLDEPLTVGRVVVAHSGPHELTWPEMVAAVAATTVGVSREACFDVAEALAATRFVRVDTNDTAAQYAAIGA